MKLKTFFRFMFISLSLLVFFLFGCNNATTTEIPTTEPNATTIITTTIAITTQTQTTATTTTTSTTEKYLTNVEIDETSLEDYYDIALFDITDLYLYLTFSDDSFERIPVNGEMLSSGDNDLLSQAGIHTITINYQEFSIEVTLDLRDMRLFQVVF
jgi:hypothetical protein